MVEGLPFLSLVNLRDAVRRIGYEVTVDRIENDLRAPRSTEKQVWGYAAIGSAALGPRLGPR